MIETDVLILGGGLSGLSTAYHLERFGASYLLVEKEARWGGTAASLRRGGFTFDLSGHLLHLHHPEGRALAGALLRGNLSRVRRRAWIRLRGRYSRYPFQANTHGLPIGVVVDCLAGFLDAARRTRRPAGPESFARWSLERFGEGICRHFMFPYNRKLWLLPPEKLTADWQGRFVPRPAAAEVLAGALLDQTKGFGYNAVFHYPRRGGSGALVQALVERLPAGRLRAGCPALSVDLERRRAVIAGLGTVSFRRLVNTAPLPDFMDISGPWPAAARRARRRLRWNSVWCLNLGVGRPDETGRHWAYFPERRYPFYRVGCYSNFSPRNVPAGASSYYVEVAVRGGRALAPRGLEPGVLDGLREAGVLRRGDRLPVKEWVSIPCGYVVYDGARAPALAVIGRCLRARGVESIGRYGAWKYSFMEEALLDGKACASRLAGLAAPERRTL